jgi:Ca2+-binding RTX toxin-like protein
LNKTSLTGGLTLDATGDTVSTLNLTVSAAPGTFVLTAGDTDVVATGSKALVLTNTSTAGSFNASAMTGAVSAETDSDFATLTTGSGADTITNGDTASVINTGSGNDSISDAGVGLASGKSINGGDGTDTLTVTATADFSAGTLSNIEYVDIDTGVTASVADAFVNGTSIAFTNDGVLAVKKITANLDLSNHTFSDSAHTVVVDYVTNKATTLGSTSATTITGSSVADTIDTHGGADTITAGSGNDDVDAGDGADTIYGQGGNDTLDGEGGADYIDGGAGNDTILGGDGADTIVAGAGEDVITGGALADSISLGADEESDDVILNEFATFDSISGFEAASDVIIVDFSALEALANDAVYLDDGASLTNETDAPAFNTIDGAADLGSATANSNILVIDGTIASASALETALETGGDFELKIEGGLGLGDIFLVLFSNGTDTFLAAVETTDTVADEAFIGAGDLTATVIAKLVGISDPTTLTAANFDYQA